MREVLITYLLSFALLTVLSAQTNWYVAPNGSDANGYGSLTAPFATIAYAAEKAGPGDSVLVRSGVYRNSDFDDGDIWKGSNAVKITAHGAPGNYITFMPYQDEEVKIEFDGTYGVLLSNSSYLKFMGFEVKGIADQIAQSDAEAAWGLYKTQDGSIHDLAEEMGVDPTDPAIIGSVIDKPATPNISKPNYFNGRGIVANSSHHIEIIGNIVRDVPSSAIRSQQSDYVTIRGNEVFGNTYWTTQGVGAITVAEAMPIDNQTTVKIILEKNQVHHNENRLISWAPSKDFVKFVIDEGTGLFLTRNADTYTHGQIGVFNNISYYNGASGIVCHKTNGAVIEHNTVYKNGTTNHGSTGGIALNTANDVKILNNIAYAVPEKFALGWLSSPGANVIVSNNLLFNENGSEDIHRNMPDGWMEDNPLFVNGPAGNFRLTANSPAVDAGATFATQTDDIEGSPRNDGLPDMGAYEYFSTSTHSTKSPRISVFPNPFRSQMVVKGVFQAEDIRLFHQTGQDLTKEIFMEQSFGEIVVSCPTLMPGVYFLKVKNRVILLLKV